MGVEWGAGATPLSAEFWLDKRLKIESTIKTIDMTIKT